VGVIKSYLLKFSVFPPVIANCSRRERETPWRLCL
jgi:hypothetical protein